MRTVFKYELWLTDGSQAIATYPGPIRHIAFQQGKICLWIEVDTESESKKVVRRFMVFGTGHPIPEKVCWVGTTQDVWHVYEEEV